MKHVKLEVDGFKDGKYDIYQIVTVEAKVGTETVMVGRLLNKDVDWPEEVERWHHPDFTFSCLDMTVVSGYEGLFARALQHPANVSAFNRIYHAHRNNLR